ncbi:MAG: cation-transporting P-type ATPase [Kouleothrix sp.]|nr:cation-transporting P-type ATPase [Kouleothrix sp.]
MTDSNAIARHRAICATIHTLPAAHVYSDLQTQPQGIAEGEAAARLARFGPNTLSEIRRTPLAVRLLANFTHLMALLLWAGGLIGFLAQMPQLGVAIWAVNLINGAFSFWQEYKAEQATAALRRMLPSYARVLRDGEERRVLAEQLVPGDVLLLAEGEHVSADARLVQTAELRVDQSPLTGESYPVRKTGDAAPASVGARAEVPNLIFAGTSVVAGTGKAVVFATGMETAFGGIAQLTQTIGEAPSPLQQELAHVTRTVTLLAVGIGLLFFALSIALAGVNLADSFIFAMGMIVAFVPEGMVPTVTLALAMGVQRMARRHALVKRLSAVETLGCTTVICTDKTGTLTQNEMTVRELWVAGRRLTVSGGGYAPEGQILEADRPLRAPLDDDLGALLRAAGLCNDARLLPPNGDSPRWSILGDPTEAALLVAAGKAGLDLAEEERRAPRVRELPFDSRRKRMSTIHRRVLSAEFSVLSSKERALRVQHSKLKTQNSELVAYVKGAPKEILALCATVQIGGQPVPLTEQLRAQVAAANDEYARAGLRVLGVAYRSLDGASPQLPDLKAEDVERDLIFLGLTALLDPPRAEVAAAVAQCHRAGIRIVMITGDYGLTAESIARRIGILRGPSPRVLTGGDLEELDDDALKAALAGEVIFARVAPEHKLRVVRALQELGEIVAVTGDGVNDAPALKKADIGVAMGLAGTDVAKEAADMILTDDNFASIVSAVEEGRAVYANIKKFISYIFTSNAPEAVPFVLFAFSGGRIPLALSVMQILSIDLGTDMVPALALGVEPPELGVMDRPPRDRAEHVIGRPLLFRSLLYLGLIQSLVAMLAFYFVYWTGGYWGRWLDLPADGQLYRSATAMTLAAVVATQIGNLFAHRTERVSAFRVGWGANRLVWLGIASELILVAAIVYVPFFQWVFGTAALPAISWLLLLACAPTLLLADELRKALLRATNDE